MLEISRNLAHTFSHSLTPLNSSPEPVSVQLNEKNQLDNSLASNTQTHLAYAKLVFTNWCYYVQATTITIGRQSEGNTYQADCLIPHVSIVGSKSISRLHSQISYNFKTKNWDFYCIGRNGAIIDGLFCSPNSTSVLLKK